jgi:hypothetical protein
VSPSRSNGGIKYSNYYAFSFLVAGTVISAFFALLLLFIDLILCCARRTSRKLWFRWFVVLCDFVRSLLSSASDCLCSSFLLSYRSRHPVCPILGTSGRQVAR